MEREEAEAYRFDDFILDVRERCLRRRGHDIYLRPRTYEALIYLVERHGQLVEKNELLDALWPDAVVTENALTQSIKELRQALDDDALHPTYIRTVPRVGYKFIAVVERLSAGAEAGEFATGPNEETVRPGEPALEKEVIGLTAGAQSIDQTVRGRRWRFGQGLITSSGSRLTARTWLFVLGGLVGLILVGIVARSYLFSSETRSIRSVAVLPFVNLSADPEQDYFVDGMTEALITDLAKLEGLQVVSRTSIMQYRGAKKSLPEIARELSVEAIVEGAVLRSGDRVRITAQLIHAATDQHLWSDAYERDVRDIIGLQREVSQTIARRIKTTLTPQEQEHLTREGTANSAAYEAYLRGRFCWNQRTEDGFVKGIDYFRQAIEHDRNYALAYVGLADCYNMLNGYDVIAPRDAVPKARAAALKALEIDDSMAEAHASLGFAKMHYDWDWAGAERSFKRAIDLNPNYAEAHHWYGLYLAMMERFDEARAQIEQARALDPVSLIINTNVGWVLYFARRYDEAIEQFGKTLDLDPNFISARIKLAWTLMQVGRAKEAAQEIRSAFEQYPDDISLLALLGHAYAVSGQDRDALKILHQLTSQSSQRYISPFLIALIHTGLGQKGPALAWIEKAYEDRSSWLAWIRVDPRLDSLRSDPRFIDLLRRLKLADR